MIGLTLKQLRYFDAVAREKHFGRAADACAVTQPALSMQIQELEAMLGVSLLERTRSGVTLTKTGEVVYQRAIKILKDARDLVDVAKHAERVLTGPLNFGVIPSVAPYLLPPVLPALKDEFPELQLRIRETQTATLMEELSKGRVDVVLLALPVDEPDIETMELFEDFFLLALPEGKQLDGHVRATPDMIENDRLLLLEEGHCLRDQALTFCGLQQVQSVNAFGASSLSTVVEMVSAGLGITLLPEICRPVETRGRALSLLQFMDPEPSRTLGLAWRATSPRKQDFIEIGRLLLQVTQGLRRDGSDVVGSQGDPSETTAKQSTAKKPKSSKKAKVAKTKRATRARKG